MKAVLPLRRLLPYSVWTWPRLLFVTQFLVLAAQAVGADSLLSFGPGARATGVRLPFLDRATGKVLARVYISSLESEHERRGHFRIGAFPVLVATGTVIQVYHEDVLCSRAQELTAWLRSLADRSTLEFRRVVVKRCGEISPLVQAGRMSLTSSGGLALSGGVILRIDKRVWEGCSAVVEFDATDGIAVQPGSEGALRDEDQPASRFRSHNSHIQLHVKEER